MVLVRVRYVAFVTIAFERHLMTTFLRHPSRRGLGVIALVLAVFGLLVSTGAAQAAAREKPSTYHCSAWKDGQRYCAKFSVFKQKFDADYTRTFHNGFKRQTVSFQCSTSKQTTWKFSVSATVKAQAGVIFAKAEASATAGVERSVTTTDSASATIRVKPKHYAHCKRGAYVYSIRGTMRHTYCSGPHCTHRTKNFTAHAPSRDAFFVGPGRG